MDTQAHQEILKRVGTVLIIAGLIDIGMMVYCIINKFFYSTSLGIFAVGFGILLRRGSLRTAGNIAWFLSFGLPLTLCLTVANFFYYSYRATIIPIPLACI